MFYELIAVVAAGFAGGGFALMARHTIKRLPRWLVPITAGSAMLLVAISLEYSWFERTRDGLPEGVEVALTRENTAPWRPWTYVHPFVDGFVAVDAASMRTHEAQPDQRLLDVLVFKRWTPPSRISAVFDCADGRRADLVGRATLGADGTVTGATWHEAGLDHPVTRIACANA